MANFVAHTGCIKLSDGVRKKVLMRQARTLREQLGLSVAEVYKVTDIDFSHLSKFERGETDLSLRNLQKLAVFYGCKIDDLVAEMPDVDPAPAAKG